MTRRSLRDTEARGRSIPNRFFILDEAQQLTPQEAKTIVAHVALNRGERSELAEAGVQLM